MKKLLRRIRGALGTALTWAVAWGGVGVIAALVAGGIGGPLRYWGDIVFFAASGLIGGGAFSVVLRIAEGRRRFDEMSLPRFASWGAVGGLLLSMLLGGAGWPPTVSGALFVGVVTLMGAGSAAGSLALARRAEDRELLEAGEEALGLTEGG